MRPTVIAAASVGIWLASAAPLWAGLYNTAEPPEGPRPNKEGKVEPIPFTPFRNLLVDLIKVGIDPKDSLQPETDLRKQYLKKRDKLQEKELAGIATLQDQINLSAYLIRLGQVPDAFGILRGVRSPRRPDFMLQGNLASA